jgi:hypothetical protein
MWLRIGSELRAVRPVPDIYVPRRSIHLRKFLIAALTAIVSAALLVSSAFGALDHTLSAKPTGKAGTKNKPRNVVLSTGVAVVRTPPDAQNPTVSTIDFLFPKEFTFNTKLFKTCSKSMLGSEGVAGCPKGSQIGEGTADATLGPGDVPLFFKTTFFNAGGTKLVIHLQAVNASGQPLEGTYESPTGTFTKAGGKYGRKLRVAIPVGVQRPAGTYSKLVKLDFRLDDKYKGKTFTQSTGCRSSYSFSSRLAYEPNPAPPSVSSTTKTAKAPCKK